MLINQYNQLQEYTSVKDVPTEDVPVIVLTTPGSTVKVTTKPTDKTTTTVPSVTAVDAKEDTPTLSEVTPKTVTEEITDIKVTGQEEGTKTIHLETINCS